MNRHTVEMGVLFRTIDDFVADIMFVDEIIEKIRLLAPLTLGLSIPIAGAIGIGTDATRAVTAEGRQRKILAEQIRCSVLACRICERRWTPTDWTAIHAREAEGRK